MDLITDYITMDLITDYNTAVIWTWSGEGTAVQIDRLKAVVARIVRRVRPYTDRERGGVSRHTARVVHATSKRVQSVLRPYHLPRGRTANNARCALERRPHRSACGPRDISSGHIGHRTSPADGVGPVEGRHGSGAVVPFVGSLQVCACRRGREGAISKGVGGEKEHRAWKPFHPVGDRS